MQINSYLKILNLFFLLMAVAAYSILFVSNLHNIHPRSAAYFGILLTLLLLNFKNLKLNFSLHFKSFEWILLSFSVVLSFYFVSKELSIRSIWLDEYTQFLSIIPGADQLVDVARRSAQEQQPFLSYLYSYLSFKIFGYSVIGVRIFSILSYFFLSALTSLFAFHFTRSKGISLLSLFLFFGNSHLSNFSVEARPYMLSALLSFGLLVYLYERLQDSNHDYFLFSSLFFLTACSSSIQPMLMGLTAVISFLILTKDNREIKVKYLKATSLITLIIIPILLQIKYESDLKEKIKHSFDWNFFYTKISHIFSVVFTSYTTEAYIVFAFIFLTIITFFIYKNDKSPIYFFSVFLGALISIALTLTIFVNWNVFPRYFIVLQSLILLACPIYLKNLYNSKSYEFKHWGIVASILLTFIVIRDYRQNLLVNKHADIKYIVPNKELFHFFTHNTKPNDIGLFLNFNYFGWWRGAIWVGSDFYYDNKQARLLNYSLYNDDIPYIQPSQIPPEGCNIFLVQRKIWSKIELSHYVPFFKDKHPISIKGHYNIYSFYVKDFNEWLEVLKEIINSIPEEFRFSPMESLIYYYMKTQNQEEFNRYLDAYKKLNPYPKNDYSQMGFVRDRILLRDKTAQYLIELYEKKKNNEPDI